MKNLVSILIAVMGVFCWAQESRAADKITVKVSNPLNESRSCETILIELKSLPGFKKVEPAVYSDSLKKFIPYQIIDNNGDGKGDELIFQADFDANQIQQFEITEANATNQVKQKDVVSAYYIRQRKDDFAWENDKIAFRMYGQELQRTELTSSGIDVWVKKVQEPAMLYLYGKGHDYFHADNPLAIDFYNIGPTLGCGGLGVWYDGKLYRSENYYEWKIIANGPIRTIFELSYKPWQFGDKKVGEIKRISLDAGSNFNHIESRFDADVKNTTLAVGIVKCERGGKATYGKDKNWLVYWENPHPKFGIIGCGVILPKAAARGESAEDEKNNLLLGKANGKGSISYYAGAGWSKSAQFDSEEKWIAFVEKTARLIEKPLKVKVQKAGK
jgi:unsaturated rhamnogalacturonyl hydrolase